LHENWAFAPTPWPLTAPTTVWHSGGTAAHGGFHSWTTGRQLLWRSARRLLPLPNAAPLVNASKRTTFPYYSVLTPHTSPALSPTRITTRRNRCVRQRSLYFRRCSRRIVARHARTHHTCSRLPVTAHARAGTTTLPTSKVCGVFPTPSHLRRFFTFALVRSPRHCTPPSSGPLPPPIPLPCLSGWTFCWLPRADTRLPRHSTTCEEGTPFTYYHADLGPALLWAAPPLPTSCYRAARDVPAFRFGDTHTAPYRPFPFYPLPDNQYHCLPGRFCDTLLHDHAPTARARLDCRYLALLHHGFPWITAGPSYLPPSTGGLPFPSWTPRCPAGAPAWPPQPAAAPTLRHLYDAAFPLCPLPLLPSTLFPPSRGLGADNPASLCLPPPPPYPTFLEPTPRRGSTDFHHYLHPLGPGIPLPPAASSTSLYRHRTLYLPDITPAAFH